MGERNDLMELSLLKSMAYATMSRRDALRRAAGWSSVLVAGGMLPGLLAACGSDDESDEEPAVPQATSTNEPGEQPGTPEPTSADAAEDAATSPSSEGNVTRGGSLSWAYTVLPGRLDAIWTQSRADWTALANIVEGLIRADARAELEPALAEEWEVSEDGLVYTFHLRPGVVFHNGDPLTTEDVIASLDRASKLGVFQWSLEKVSSIEKIDDSSVQITLSSPVASFLAGLAMLSNAIFPMSEIERIGEEEFTEPIGTGPFKVTEWVRNDRITLDRNADYWKIAEDGEPYPYLDQVVLTQVAEDTTKVLQIQAGDLNGTEGIPFSQIPELEGDSRGQLAMFPQQQIYFMVLQLTRPPFDDVKVRQAMSLALNRQVFVDRVTAGTAEVANSLMPSSGDCWNPNLELPYDLDRARQLIAESSYPDGHSGAKLQLSSGVQIGRDNAVLAKEMWDQIGIELTIEEVEGSTLGDNWYASNYEAISGYQWTNSMADPEQLIQFFFIEPRMNTGYEPSQHAIDLVHEASEELDPDKRCEIYHELQEIYNEDVGGTISLYYTPSVNYLSPDVRGFFRSPLGAPFFWETWLEG